MKLTDLAPQPQPAITNNEVHKDDFFDKYPESNMPFYRKLGRTDLTVSSLGIGGGGGISSEDTLYAFEQGINYFFYSSDLHHFLYTRMSSALRQLCGRGSSAREKVVLATVTYIKSPEMILAALLDQIGELGVEYIDIFFWGWIGTNDGAALKSCLDLSEDLRGANSPYQRTMEKMYGTSEKLKKMGLVRYIGASFHDLNLAQQWSTSPLLDVVMVRHNAAHRSAQNKVFSYLDPEETQRPGIVTFKSTGSHSGSLWNAPVGLPNECWKPSVPDLYRYSLSQSCVDVCLTGLRRREEVDAAISGIQKGTLTSAELDYLKIYGDLHRNKLRIEDVNSDQLIYQI
jgi:predicted aldo/keto reductase-like oxidoreductase